MLLGQRQFHCTQNQASQAQASSEFLCRHENPLQVGILGLKREKEKLALADLKYLVVSFLPSSTGVFWPTACFTTQPPCSMRGMILKMLCRRAVTSLAAPLSSKNLAIATSNGLAPFGAGIADSRTCSLRSAGASFLTGVGGSGPMVDAVLLRVATSQSTLPSFEYRIRRLDNTITRPDRCRRGGLTDVCGLCQHWPEARWCFLMTALQRVAAIPRAACGSCPAPH